MDMPLVLIGFLMSVLNNGSQLVRFIKIWQPSAALGLGYGEVYCMTDIQSILYGVLSNKTFLAACPLMSHCY